MIVNRSCVAYIRLTADEAAECSVCQGWTDKDPERQIQPGAGGVEHTEAEGIESHRTANGREEPERGRTGA